MSFRPDEVPRLYRLLDFVHDGCPGHGPIHALVASARRIWLFLGLFYDQVGSPLDFLVIVILLVLFIIFRSAILDAWRKKVAVDFLCS